ncbi:Acetylene hydratase [Fundidesulfovibrio magnetotacticus]|uniref:Acetylene hydratase n=1 Tax=Fundidesulfovibrio magnetotacticus TaxID=2730080 RepID=A0A6V8LJM6_9BACT|nr:molybdopterin-dependent oxidoreductase [Fundidesulfovibrio magnetotacticus]GFK92923.1 Acetylene hydratase [Fundidesulfovibrio magnetotacticus]
MDSARIVRTSCRGCHGVCQVLVHLDAQGRVLRIAGDPESPTSRGFICPKGAHAARTLHHPERLATPLRRVGARGEGRFEPVSWDEALEIMAETFDRVRRESGPEFLALHQGTGRPYTEFTGRFIHALGSSNFVSPGHNCFLPRNIASALTVGWLPIADIYGRGGATPGSFLVFGCNSMETGAADGMCGAMIAKALRKARSVVVADPRTTPTAREADIHLRLRPGTECALALALLHVIVGENLHDKAFVEAHCNGFPELREHLIPLSPQWAEPITRVPAEAIRRAARALAADGPCAVLWGNGIDTSVNAFQTARALLSLMAVTGSLDVPGGMVRWVAPAGVRCKSPQEDKAQLGMQFLTPEQKARMIGAGRFPFGPGCHQPTFWEACLTGRPYRPRALWLVGTNPLLTATRGDVIEKALREHIEFTVASDLFLTPTAALCDLVLPAAHWLEQDDVVYFHKIWCVLARRKTAQVGQARDDRAVMLHLARRLGLHEAFPWADWEAYLAWLLEPSGMSFEEFADKGVLLGEMRYRKHETEGFPAPGGKVDLASRVLAGAGRPALPAYVEPPLSPVSRPDLARDYPLILMTGCKVQPFFHSEGRQIEPLRRLRPEPLVAVHPEAAARSGLSGGDAAFVVTPHGRARFVVALDEGLAPDVVSADHGWWFPERGPLDPGWKENNANMLFGHEHFDPDCGAEPLKCGLCRLERA